MTLRRVRVRRVRASRACTSCSAPSCASPGRAWAAATTGRSATAAGSRRSTAPTSSSRSRTGISRRSCCSRSSALRGRGVAPARASPASAGRGGVLRAAALAVALGFGAALLGAITVKLGNAPFATLAHWTVAMSLVAAVVGHGDSRRRARRTSRARAAARRARRRARPSWAPVMALLTVVMGGLTAKYPGAAVACPAFPLCGTNPDVLGGRGARAAHASRAGVPARAAPVRACDGAAQAPREPPSSGAPRRSRCRSACCSCSWPAR